MWIDYNYTCLYKRNKISNVMFIKIIFENLSRACMNKIHWNMYSVYMVTDEYMGRKGVPKRSFPHSPPENDRS